MRRVMVLFLHDIVRGFGVGGIGGSVMTEDTSTGVSTLLGIGGGRTDETGRTVTEIAEKVVDAGGDRPDFVIELGELTGTDVWPLEVPVEVLLEGKSGIDRNTITLYV